MLVFVDLVVTAVVLQFVANVTDSFEVRSWTTAFVAAIVVMVVSQVIVLVAPSMPLSVAWQMWAFLFISNIVILALTSLVVPGVTLHGVLGLLVASALLTLVTFALPQILASMRLAL